MEASETFTLYENEYFALTPILKIYVTYFQPYFCGQDLECTKHNSPWALKRAMERVDEHYPVVAVLEELDKSLMVMQNLMPRFFGGIWDLFGNGKSSESKTRGE